MSLRDDLVPVVDDVREMIDDLGLRLHTVQTRRITWSGGAPGLGDATVTDVALSPAPKVRNPSPRERVAEPGRFEEGDRLVEKISATYTEADLDGGAIADAEEFYWLIDGDPYRVVGKPLERFLGWTVQLRRMR